MTSLIKLTTMAAVLLTGAVFTADADAGSCRSGRCAPRRVFVPSRRPVPRPAFPGPGVGAAGLGGGVQQRVAGAGTGPTQQAGTTQAVSVPAGATITLPGNRGAQMGQVNLILSGVRLPLTVLDWNENGVTLTLPDMQITTATQAQLEIKLPGSNTAETLSIQLQPRPTVLIHGAPVIVTPPAPAEAMAPTAPQPEQLVDN